MQNRNHHVRQAFPDFDDNLDRFIDELPDGWKDGSWKNDTMPRLDHVNSVATLWIDYADPLFSENAADRLTGSFKRFLLQNELTDEFATDVWSVMRDYVWCHQSRLEGEQ
jgi:hypothetical protein